MQRVPLIYSQHIHQSTHKRKLIKDGERITRKDQVKQYLTFTKGQEQYLPPPAGFENFITLEIWNRECRWVLTHQCRLTSPRLNTVLVKPTKLKSGTERIKLFLNNLTAFKNDTQEYLWKQKKNPTLNEVKRTSVIQ